MVKFYWTKVYVFLVALSYLTKSKISSRLQYEVFLWIIKSNCCVFYDIFLKEKQFFFFFLFFLLFGVLNILIVEVSFDSQDICYNLLGLQRCLFVCIYVYYVCMHICLLCLYAYMYSSLICKYIKLLSSNYIQTKNTSQSSMKNFFFR